MSCPTRPKDTGEEAYNQGSLEDNYRSNLVNKASRDRIWIKYNDNWPNLPCKPYPLAYKRRGRGGLKRMNHNTTDAHKS
jgi:hypothetical protein